MCATGKRCWWYSWHIIPPKWYIHIYISQDGPHKLSCSMILYLSLHPGVDIFRGRIQAFWLVPHSDPVWLLLHVWTCGTSAHTGQTQKVTNLLLPNDTRYPSFIFSASSLSLTCNSFLFVIPCMYTPYLADVLGRISDEFLLNLLKQFNTAIHFSTTLYFPVFQDTREDLYDDSISNSGHYGPVQYLSGLLELPHTGHLQVL